MEDKQPKMPDFFEDLMKSAGLGTENEVPRLREGADWQETLNYIQKLHKIS